MLEAVELLKQNLTIDSDLQNFINFAMKSVGELGGNTFAAAIASLDLIEKLRSAGAGTGRPLPVSLMLQDNQIVVQWDKQGHARIASLKTLPLQETVIQLCRHLQNSTVATDPDILLQRNAEMERHFNEARAHTEHEMGKLHEALKVRQLELQEVVLQAETDALTGLFNRRAFDEKLKRAFLHTMRQKKLPLSLLLIDLDHFKKINDEFGHQVGDEYLKNSANILHKIFREDVDLVFRFGGDEFAVVLYADYSPACEKSKQVLKLMDNRVSIGIATINQETGDDLTIDEFFRRADNALYKAKNRGRGQVVSDFCTSQKKRQCQLSCTDNSQP